MIRRSWRGGAGTLVTTLLLLPAAASAAPAFKPLANLAYPSYPWVFGGPALRPNGSVVIPMAIGVPSLVGRTVSLKPPTATGGAWTLSTLATFATQAIGMPTGALVADAAGNLYGAAAGGGTTTSPCGSVAGAPGCGAIYRLATGTSGTTTLTVLSKFAGGTDGAGPTGDLTPGPGGVFYGATAYGGGSTACGFGCGTIFKLTPSGTGFTRTTLYRFKGKADGTMPGGNLALDAAGTLYGTTLAGGLTNCLSQSGLTPDGGCGTVFSLTQAGVKTTLYSFTDGAAGSLPAPGLALSKTGVLYGAAASGGNTGFDCANRIGRSGCGLVFSLTPPSTAGGAWQRATIWTFSGTDGATPNTPLLDGAGALYLNATNSLGGAAGCSIFYCGAVVKLSPPAPGASVWTRTVLYTFANGGTDNAAPIYRLTADGAGTLYGVSQYGSVSGVFSITGAGYMKP